jgi:hypothetical protein
MRKTGSVPKLERAAVMGCRQSPASRVHESVVTGPRASLRQALISK